MLTEIRIAGFGGQGVILATHILGRAAAVHENRYATMTQSYGPEARGGAASAALIVSDEPVLFPYVAHPDILVVMSQEAYTRFTPEVKPGGYLLVEEDLVRLDHTAQGLRIYGIPATRFAEELGKKMVLNVIMTGFLCAITGAVSAEAARKSVEESVPARFRELNLQAFDKGFEYGRLLLERGPQKLDNSVEIPLETEV
ncbi:MAG: 2-oxoglutarate ferredoxin oxidoreductase subunit gamma [Bryobacteraceae bacterium]|nr:MAG: 2-oxoglutarate ferredoxin oxidoreductase subunit gamma [Bryobacteraceae bacterium]